MDSLSKNSLPVFFFLSELSPLAELCPFEGLKVQICNHDISKTTTARSFKLGQLIKDDKKINLFLVKIKKKLFFFNYLPLQIWTLKICNHDFSKTITA